MAAPAAAVAVPGAATGGSRIRIPNSTSPRSVNFTALPTKFAMICRSRSGSPVSTAGTLL